MGGNAQPQQTKSVTVKTGMQRLVAKVVRMVILAVSPLTQS